MLLSIVIPTRNRANQIKRLLRTLLVLPQPARWGFEIVVACNACTDDSEAAVVDVAQHAPLKVRAVNEPRTGVAVARNAGVAAAAGEVILFLDDDVEVESDYLCEVARSLEAHPEAQAFGGPVFPLWKEPMPAWVARDGPFVLRQSLVIKHSLGSETREYSRADNHPLTANFWFKRAMFEKLGGFDQRLTRRGEDADFCGRALRAGYKLRFWPTARVYHPVYADRARRGYLYRWYFDAGWAWGYYHRNSPRERTILGVPLWMLGETPSLIGRCIGREARSDRCAAFYNRCQLIHRLSQVLSSTVHHSWRLRARRSANP